MFDISNRRRLGLSEVQCVTDMYNGVKKLLDIERAAVAYVLFNPPYIFILIISEASICKKTVKRNWE